MSRSGLVILPFLHEERPFRMAIGDLEALQERLASSPFAVYERLARGVPMVGDIVETIRIGLIGGGSLDATGAAALMKRWREGEPAIAEMIPLAMGILGAGLHGVEDESPGKSPGADAEPTSSPPEA